MDYGGKQSLCQDSKADMCFVHVQLDRKRKKVVQLSWKVHWWRCPHVQRHMQGKNLAAASPRFTLMRGSTVERSEARRPSKRCLIQPKTGCVSGRRDRRYIRSYTLKILLLALLVSLKLLVEFKKSIVLICSFAVVITISSIYFLEILPRI
jgi:hypothetical protein